MGIYITGDIHGGLSVSRLGSKNFPQGKDLTKDDYVIVLGDFGLVWFPEGDKRSKGDRWWLDWLDDKPFTTLFVDGNHENHDLLNAYQVDEWHGGKVHRIRERVIHLMRGQVFDLAGKSFFAMGGAYSHDIEYRTEGLSWWRSEVPSQAEREEALAALNAHGWKVDYVLTHCAPTSALPSRHMLEPLSPDEYTDWLQDEVEEKLDYKKWFFGHYHRTYPMTRKHWCICNAFFDLEQNALHC